MSLCILRRHRCRCGIGFLTMMVRCNLCAKLGVVVTLSTAPGIYVMSPQS
jgi:hypothetical protein